MKATKTIFILNQSHKGKFIKWSLVNINIIFTRNLSRGLPNLTLTPVVRYINAKESKSLIYQENKDKSFVYRWTNQRNGKEYLGSTANAKRRLSTYYDLKGLEDGNMPIYKAILKYGHENFIFDIIEYCQPDEVIQREQYYLDNFDFSYNVLAKAESILGYKHTEETRAKMKGRKNLLGYNHTPETIERLREIQMAKSHSEEAMQKMREVWAERKLDSLKITETLQTKTRKQIEGKIVVVRNIKTNISTEYISISDAATSLNVTRVTLRTYIKNKKVFSVIKQDTSGLVKESFLISLKDNN
uniref:GIY-YIG homing endonuclease n=1 Tax=Tricholoma bakamatsutake TaxID=51221 RepID=A0A6C0W4A7_9AGAR|nr:GIY-YIG homing endonuclease [Tricholoma bakamatsutake]QIC20206.1 GIY-YIG homing endonuclease [Tricholoma bakamatsutake]